MSSISKNYFLATSGHGLYLINSIPLLTEVLKLHILQNSGTFPIDKVKGIELKTILITLLAA